MSWLLFIALALAQPVDLDAWEPVRTRAGTLRLSGRPDAPVARIRQHLWQRLTGREESDEVRAAFVDAWLRTGPSADDQRRVWASSGERVRQVMVVASLDAGWPGVIEAALVDLSPVVRAQAAATIGRRHDLTASVRPLLSDPEPTVRLAAVRALDLRGELGPLQTLDDPDPAVRAARARALERHR